MSYATPARHDVRANGVRFCLFEWPGEGQPILLVHATGFHARIWDGVIAHLGRAHVYAVDMRGHGRTEKAPPYDWKMFGDDLVALVDALDLTEIIGVGHSMGGHSVIAAAGARRTRFQALVLVDPVVRSPEEYRLARPMNGQHPAAKRRNAWTSADEMFDRFKDRDPFRRWQPNVLHDYCDFGIAPAPDGEGYVLACPPEVEAAIYAGAAATDITGIVAELDLPVTVLRAGGQRAGNIATNFSASPTWPGLAAHFPNARDAHLEHATHFMPMEEPALVAGHILDMAARFDRRERVRT